MRFSFSFVNDCRLPCVLFFTKTKMAIRVPPHFLLHFRSPLNLTNNTPSFFKPLAFSSSSSSSSSSPKLILYSKPGCCLCDGLKDKLHAAFTLPAPNSLAHVQLQIRDITSNPEWEKLYQYEIPVLARLRDDGTEETLPRLSPRLGIEVVQKKIAAAFNQ